MRIDVITLFPKMFEGVMGESIIARAVKNGLVEIHYHDMRKWAWNNYGAVDDRPYGGDVGMLIRVDVIDKALEDIRSQMPAYVKTTAGKSDTKKTRVILMGAGGKRFGQDKAEKMAMVDEDLIIICGHYEGFDERVLDLVDEEISIGDFVLTGGEIPAMAIIDSVVRLLPGVLGKDESSKIESFSEIEIDGKKVRAIEYPQYTRPAEYEGKKVPEVLLSGDPKKIKQWQTTEIKKNLG